MTAFLGGALLYLVVLLLVKAFTGSSDEHSQNKSRQPGQDLREMQLLEQQKADDNHRATVAGITGALAGAALMHQHDAAKGDEEIQKLRDALESEKRRLNIASEKDAADADDAEMDLDEFLNTARSYDSKGNLTDYDDADSSSHDSDDDWSGSSGSSSDDSSFGHDDDFGGSFGGSDDSFGGHDDYGGGDDGGWF